MSNIIETSCGYFSLCPAKTERRPGTGPFHIRSISPPHILIIPSHCHTGTVLSPHLNTDLVQPMSVTVIYWDIYFFNSLSLSLWVRLCVREVPVVCELVVVSCDKSRNLSLPARHQCRLWPTITQLPGTFSIPNTQSFTFSSPTSNINQFSPPSHNSPDEAQLNFHWHFSQWQTIVGGEN